MLWPDFHCWDALSMDALHWCTGSTPVVEVMIWSWLAMPGGSGSWGMMARTCTSAMRLFPQSPWNTIIFLVFQHIYKLSSLSASIHCKGQGHIDSQFTLHRILPADRSLPCLTPCCLPVHQRGHLGGFMKKLFHLLYFSEEPVASRAPWISLAILQVHVSTCYWV